MELSRRDFLRASSAIAAAWGLTTPETAEAAVGAPQVVWLQGQGCSGCSVSFLNSISLGTVDGLLTKTLDVQYHPTLMASAGASAIKVAQDAYTKGGFILVVEGAIPTADSGRYCYLWDGMTMLDGVRQYAAKAKYIVACGTCSAFGCIVGGKPNPTGVQRISTVIGTTLTSKLVCVPGCPVHPDWLVGTVSSILTAGRLPSMDSNRRPTAYFGRKLHEQCPYKEDEETKCFKEYGCKGPKTFSDCSRRKWNAAAAGANGTTWCIGAGRPWGTPCLGCTEPTFPDGMSPFYTRNYVGSTSRRTTTQANAAEPTAESQAAPADAAPAPTADAQVPSVNDLGDSTAGSDLEHVRNQNKSAFEKLREQNRAEYQKRLNGARKRGN
jgi:NiFe hydrogenase small subunit HydA